jgi:4'-phosphopantetheinyl transferase
MQCSVYWLVQTLRDVPQDHDWLGPGEIERLRQMRFPKRRSDWTLGRWTGKRALLSYLALTGRTVQSNCLEIGAADDGAPEASLDGVHQPWSISISHSGGLGFAAVSEACAALGCDLELVEIRPESLFADFFTDEENRFLERSPEPDRAMLSTLIWSAKESALKCLREGLRRDTRSVAVSLHPGQSEGGWRPVSVRCRELNQTFDGWWRTELGCVLSVTSQPPPSPPIRLT